MLNIVYGGNALNKTPIFNWSKYFNEDCEPH